jgi:hypothetical protein
MNNKVINQRQKGEGESSLMITIFGAAIAISVCYYAINWILAVKEARRNGGVNSTKVDETRPPPKTVFDMGGYEVEY